MLRRRQDNSWCLKAAKIPTDPQQLFKNFMFKLRNRLHFLLLPLLINSVFKVRLLQPGDCTARWFIRIHQRDRLTRLLFTAQGSSSLWVLRAIQLSNN